MPRKKATEGEVYLVDKPKPAEVPAIVQASPTKASKMRAKKQKPLDAIPEDIPEDKMIVQVKPKRPYNRKPKVEPQPEAQPQNTIVEPEVQPEPEPEPEPKPKKKAKAKKIRYQVTHSDTSDDSDETYSVSSSDSEDDAKIRKYARKVHKRAEALKQIDTHLRRLNNPYDAKNLSIF